MYSPREWQQVDTRWTYGWGVPSANNSLYRSSVCSISLLIRTPDICTIKNTWPVRNPLSTLVCKYLNISPSPLCPPCVPSSYQCFQAFPIFYVSFTSVLLWMQTEEGGQEIWLPGNGPYTSRYWTVYATTLAVQACVFAEPYIHIALICWQ